MTGDFTAKLSVQKVHFVADAKIIKTSVVKSA